MTTALRLCTAGSVDDGKSTFVGRLLHDTKNILADQYEAVVATSAARGQEGPDLSLLVDGLRAEREQGITIDVAYRYFATDARSFILADCPGHEQYTRNTVTGMSTAEAVVVLVDARNGVVKQTKRHATVASLLGVRHVIMAVNKIDLLDYSEEVFRGIESDVRALADRLGLDDVRVVPVSALVGDNIVDRSDRTPWYGGPSVLEILETLETPANLREGLRLPVEYVLRVPDYRGYAGRIAAGSVEVGDVVGLPGGRSAVVERVTVAGDAVANPQNLEVCIGTPIREVLEFCGLREEPHKVVTGGPMMGVSQVDLDYPIVRQNSGLLAFGEASARELETTACIRCGTCVNSCPMSLSPIEIMKAYRRGDMAALDRLMADLCMECGTCSYVCPARQPLTQNVRLARADLKAEKRKAKGR